MIPIHPEIVIVPLTDTLPADNQVSLSSHGEDDIKFSNSEHGHGDSGAGNRRTAARGGPKQRYDFETSTTARHVSLGASLVFVSIISSPMNLLHAVP